MTGCSPDRRDGPDRPPGTGRPGHGRPRLEAVTGGVAVAVALALVAGCGGALPGAPPHRPAVPSRAARQDATAATECRVLRATLRLPVSRWPDGIFSIAAEGTPPRLAAAITRMEIAVGDSYGPTLSSATIAAIAAVGDICASKPIAVTGIDP